MPRNRERFNHKDHIPTASSIEEALGKAAEFFTERSKVTLENQEHAVEAVKALEAGIPIIIFFFPHREAQDPLPLVHMVLYYLLVGQKNPEVALITSAKFTGEIKSIGKVGPGGFFSLVGRGWGKRRRLGFFPVVQKYLEEKLEGEELKTAQRLNRESLIDARNFLQQSGQNVVQASNPKQKVLILSAEATRNSLPGIIRAKRGPAWLMKKTGALALPVYMRNVRSMLPNPLSADITIGFCPLVDYQTAAELSRKLQWDHNSDELNQLKEIRLDNGETMFGDNTSFTDEDALHYAAVLNANLEIISPDMHPAGVYNPKHIILK